MELKDKVTIEDLDVLLSKAQDYLEELKEPLKDIRVPVNKNNPEILQAVQNLFGNSYITSDGNTYITFPMYLQCLQLIRSVGKNTATLFI